MYAKTMLSLFAFSLLASTVGVTARPLEADVTIVGFGHGQATISEAGVGPGSSTTFIVTPTGTADGDFAAISGPVTVIDSPSGSEARFQLAAGGSVDSKCDVNGDQAACSVEIVQSGVTATTAFTTQIPTGFTNLGQSDVPPQPTSTPNTNSGALKVGLTTAGTMLSVGVAAGVLLL